MNELKSTFRATGSFALRIAAFWLVFFLASKLIFLTVNLSLSRALSANDLLQVFKHGLALDVSMTSYFTLANVLLFSILQVFSTHGKRVIFFFNAMLIALCSLFLSIDARLYTYWGYRADFSLFTYLQTPTEAMASANWNDVFIFLTAWVVLFVLGWASYRMLVHKAKAFKCRLKPINTWVGVLFSAVLILPIRGGIGVATVGLSSAYFSNKPFANHAAINEVWNLIYTYTNRVNLATNFWFFEDKTSNTLVNKVYSQQNNDWRETPKFADGTNVVLIVLESFSAEILSQPNAQDILPNLMAWSKKGYNFSNFYSSGDRSDKGHVSLFYGFPALPNSGILEFPSKVEKLTNLFSEFKSANYQTAFMYGGSLDFANLRTIFTLGDVDYIVEKKSLPKGSKRGKWGIHDEHTFKAFFHLLDTLERPYFASLYTLSSHEPFEVPGGRTFSGRDGKFFQSTNYTDSCLGVFLNNLERSKHWQNTVVIITADHAIRKPNNMDVFAPEKFRIPLLIVGGPVQAQRTISSFSSHTDLPSSMHYMFLHSQNQYAGFSKSIFDSEKSFAFYYYQVGCGYIDSMGCSVYDLLAKRYLMQTILDSNEISFRDSLIKGYLQKVTSVFQDPTPSQIDALN
ncbi:MAG: phosphoglycerol transferase MdoB-like AlkP superfamily enzyme [Bacteroidia bacterium]|jgi:phosphoglycerol transferase MdoB-like AlkP superfamily enzyme